MLYKRGKTYWLDITVGGRRLRRSAGTTDRKAAQELHAKLSTQAWRQDQLDEKPRRIFEEAAVRWLNDKAHKRSIKSDAQRIVYWRGHFGGMFLDQITADMIYEKVNALQTRYGGKPANATKNRYAVLIQSILRRAVKWGWLTHAPMLEMLPENNKRKTFYTPEQARKLLAHLPDAHKAPVALAFLTGLRKSNVYGLRWDAVDLQRGVAWVHGDEAKAGRNITVPLNTDAKALLAGLLERRTNDNPLVFGGLNAILTKAWRRALKDAGIPPGLRFHDTRHSFASWHIMAGTDRKTVQELCAWASPAMLERYVHLTDGHMADASERLTGYICVTATPAAVPETVVTH
jgi:integrase